MRICTPLTTSGAAPPAVQAMHNLKVPLAHRDLKLGNVLIDERHQPILMDFGSAEQVRACTIYPVPSPSAGSRRIIPPTNPRAHGIAAPVATRLFAARV